MISTPCSMLVVVSRIKDSHALAIQASLIGPSHLAYAQNIQTVSQHFTWYLVHLLALQERTDIPSTNLVIDLALKIWLIRY